jgi:hypothetical protein
MKNRLAVAALVMGSVVTSVPGLAQEEAPAPPSPHNVPVLAYNRSGGFPPIPAIGELLVHSNGEAVLTKIPASVGYCAGNANAGQIAQLRAQLSAAGAFFLGDHLSPVPDAQAITVTFFVPVGTSGRARSNTFIFTAGTPGPYLEIEKAVESFIAGVFPAC